MHISIGLAFSHCTAWNIKRLWIFGSQYRIHMCDSALNESDSAAHALPEDLILSIHHSISFWILAVPSSINWVNGTLPVFRAM
jgi:hypothetical protein